MQPKKTALELAQEILSEDSYTDKDRNVKVTGASKATGEDATKYVKSIPGFRIRNKENQKTWDLLHQAFCSGYRNGFDYAKYFYSGTRGVAEYGNDHYSPPDRGYR